MNDPKSVQGRLASAKLEALRAQKSGFVAQNEEKRKEEALHKLRVAIVNALFLEPKRKKMWLEATNILTADEAETLLGAILRENIRFKKGIRKLKFKEVPEKASQGGE
jgi:hypothetical protein